MIRTVQRERGVTLLELLVVIGIITFLMASMFVGLAKLRGRTQVGQARNLVEKLNGALETYRLKFRAYPNPTNALVYDTVAKAPTYTAAELEQNNNELYYYLSTAFKKGATAAKGEVEATVDGGPFIAGGLHEGETVVKGGKTYVMDPWHKPILYKVDRRSFPDPNDATIIVRVDIPVVYSTGTNGRDDNGAGDDIVAKGQ
ncbi:MAG: type II secretion system protein [Planctomycetota bacterium]|nr:type II secretion system protein [Planctomycetota bacterium]